MHFSDSPYVRIIGSQGAGIETRAAHRIHLARGTVRIVTKRQSQRPSAQFRQRGGGSPGDAGVPAAHCSGVGLGQEIAGSFEIA